MNIRTRFGMGLVYAALLTLGGTSMAHAEPGIHEPNGPKLQVKTPRYSAIKMPVGFQGSCLDSAGQAMGSEQRGDDPMGSSFGVVYDISGRKAVLKWAMSTASSAFIGSDSGYSYLGLDFSSMSQSSPFLIRMPITPTMPVSLTKLKLGVSAMNRTSQFGGTEWTEANGSRPFRLSSPQADAEYAPINGQGWLSFLGNNGASVIMEMSEDEPGQTSIWNQDNSLTPLNDAFVLDMSSDGTVVAGTTSQGATVWTNGVEKNLGLGPNSVAQAVNSVGDIIVSTYSKMGMESTTFLMRNGKLFNLSKLAKLQKGWKIAHIADMSDAGEILLVAYKGVPGGMNSQFRTFVLKPR